MIVVSSVLAGSLALTLFGSLGARAATAVGLGTAGNYAVLAGSTVTNTGDSVLTGDLGLSPGSAVTGFPPGTINGAQHVANATAVQAKSDLTTAYNTAAATTPVTTVATELGETTKNAGVYNSSSGTFEITGTLTLDAQGDSASVFIFKTDSTLVTAGGSTVKLINGAQACNVFWQVGSSATLGISSTFKGNILALTSATLTTFANVEGRVLARNGAVTLDTNIVTKPSCASTSSPSTSAGSDTSSSTSTTVTGRGGAVNSSTSAAGGSTTPKLPSTGLAPDQSGPDRFTIVGMTALIFLVIGAFAAARRQRVS